MNTRLTFEITHGTSQERLSVEQPIVKFGRDPKCHVRVDDESWARLHAVLEVGSPDAITLIDLGNGETTLVNDRPAQKTTLRVGDAITIGRTRLVLVSAELASALARPLPPSSVSSNPFASPFDGVAPPTNPFASPKSNHTGALFGATARPGRTVVAHDAAPGTYTYELVRSGPSLPAGEMESPDRTTIEVLVRWQNDAIHVAHLTPPRAFYVGESAPRSGRPNESVAPDFFVPEEKLPARRVPLVLVEGAEPMLVLPREARGWVEPKDQPRVPLDRARETATATSELADARLVPLRLGTHARVELGGFVFEIGHEAAGKRIESGIAANWDNTVPAYFGVSLAAFTGLFSALAYFVPPLGLEDEGAIGKDRVLLIQQYLTAAAEREQKEHEEEVTSETASSEGGTGQQATGESGSMGKTTATATNKRYAVKGDPKNADPHLARERAREEARTFGMIGLLNAGPSGDPNAPTAVFGRDTSLGLDDVSAQGAMWGDEIGDSIGSAGLGLSGLGLGGGGRGEGIGLGPNGIFGNGAGTGLGQGFGPGRSTGLGMGTHKTKAPRVGIGKTVVGGRLPAEVVQRIVRQNFGRFRMCYEQGLGRNPNLEGRVAVRFVIGRDGAVSNVGNGGSDIPDSTVVGCVVSAFYGLTFPQPENGIVTVTYPIMFSPG